MRDDPLILFCSPRGGSSLVAGAFHNLGFWTGETFDGGGYQSFESIPIRNFFKLHWKLDAGNHDLDPTRADLRAFCEKVVPSDQVWLFKGLSEYYPVWKHYFPRMRAVMVYRERSQAVEAHVRRRGERVREIASQVVSQRYDFMDTVLMNDYLSSHRSTSTRSLAKNQSWRVDADKLVTGDCSQLAPVLAEYNLDLDHRLAMKSVSPEMFHQ